MTLWQRVRREPWGLVGCAVLLLSGAIMLGALGWLVRLVHP